MDEGTSRDFVCGKCSSTLIQILEWAPAGHGRFCMLVRCPECSWLGDLFLDEEQADDLFAAAADAVQDLREAADVLGREVFRESCEAFVRALRAGQVVPMDF